MMGGASEIKTKRVDSYHKKGIFIDEVINSALKNLTGCTIVDIQYRAACSEEMEDSALIIYKEPTS